MNERIKQLAEQANEVVLLDIRGDGTVDKEVAFNKEKFAELIIKECANILRAEMYRLDAIPGREVSAQTMETAQVLIKKHFGVE